MKTHNRIIKPTILRRLASMCYESLLLLGVLIVTLIAPHVIFGVFAHRTATPLVLWAHLYLVLLVYFVWFWCNGKQTLAMKTWRIRLVSSSEEPLRPAQALYRYVLCWPSIGLGGVGIIWALLDRDGLFLHDRLARTRLVTT